MGHASQRPLCHCCCAGKRMCVSLGLKMGITHPAQLSGAVRRNSSGAQLVTLEADGRRGRWLHPRTQARACVHQVQADWLPRGFFFFKSFPQNCNQLSVKGYKQITLMVKNTKLKFALTLSYIDNIFKKIHISLCKIQALTAYSPNTFEPIISLQNIISL